MPGREGRAQGQKRPTAEGSEFPQILDLPWRSTKMGGTTYNIVVCITCGKVLTPTAVTRSKRGTHGTDHYLHAESHDIEYATLLRSNSGRRSVSATVGFPKKLLDKLTIEWVYMANIPDTEVMNKWLAEG